MLAAYPSNMQAQDELAALLARNLTFEPRPSARPEREEPQIVYSISQHYHHSAHIAKPQQHQIQEQQQQEDPHASQQGYQRRASEPPQPEHQATGVILIAHGIDPSALSASQLELFKTADEPQKFRLIELWRIYPPVRNAGDASPDLAWTSTSVEQEEALAQLRYERRLQQEETLAGGHMTMTMSLDGTPVATPSLAAGMQNSDGHWTSQMQQHYMEPYMASGYSNFSSHEEPRSKDVYSHFGMTAGAASAYSSATDPVYQTTNNGADWAARQRAAEMENQYGMLMAMRESAMEI